MKKHMSLLIALLLACMLFVVPTTGLSEAAEMIEYGTQDLVDPSRRLDGIDEFLEGLQGIDGLTLQVGSRGTAVMEFQRLLIDAGYLPSGSADGMYGKKTASAVEEFQTAAGLPRTGKADVATQFMMVMIDGSFEQKKTCYVAKVENYAVIIWPEGVFYIGAVDKSDNFVEGTYYFSSGDYYGGEFKSNQRSGDGTAHFANGDVYIGKWKKDAMNGEGVYYFGGLDSNEYYEGNMTDNAMDGKGTYYLNGEAITGKWKKNQHLNW